MSKITHEIVYIGAPYADGEAGHVISRHRSVDAAERAYRRLTTRRITVAGRYVSFATAARLNHVIRVVEG